ncbi:MAG: SPW repeat protein, partial [Acidimicrobiia bacterium]
VAILAWIRVGSPLRNDGVSWTNLVLGVWLLLAPFVIGYWSTTAALWNDVILGLIVAVLAATSVVSSQGYQPETGPQPMTG